MAGSQSITLRPLSDAQALSLTANLLGDGASIRELAALVRDRAAGNPFFVEEIVRDLSERGVLGGQPGAYELRADMASVDVPATMQVTIGARVDRLEPKAKQTLNAAAVVGSRFDTELLNALIDDPDVERQIEAELVDQVRFTPHAEYAFRHPLIRTVAYESQLKSDRAQLHRRLATAIEANGPGDENAALIAEHLEAAGDLAAAFDWHMRAGAWSNLRDIAAAQTSWRRARPVADRLPESDPNRLSMRIAPRTMLCATAYFMGGSRADTGFDELRDLCSTAGDQRSLAIGMAGLVIDHQLNARRRESSRVATELVELLELIGDPTLAVGLPFTAMAAKVETGEVVELLRLAQLVIDLADGDPTKGSLIVGSPLSAAIANRGVARCWLGIAGWKEDLRQAAAMASAFDPTMHAAGLMIVYGTPVIHGAVLPNVDALRQTAEALAIAQQSAGYLAVDLAQTARGLVLVHRDGPEREAGLELFAKVRQSPAEGRFSYGTLPIVDIYIAKQKARLGDVNGAIEVIRSVVEDLLSAGRCIWTALAVNGLVELLLQRGEDGDLADAREAIDRLAAVPTDPGFVLNEIWLLRLRALLAQALDDKAAYLDFRDRYRAMAKKLGFEGRMAWAQAMP
ncbi:MAG: cyclase [Mycobacterium sp.]|nr:cyclase [Mycobacterium sp.]